MRRAAAEVTGDTESMGLPPWLIPIGGIAAAVVIATAFLVTLDERQDVIESSVAATVAETPAETAAESLPIGPPDVPVTEVRSAVASAASTLGGTDLRSAVTGRA